MSIMKTTEKAKLKTLADYALILQHMAGMKKADSCQAAMKAENEPLFLALLDRNILLMERNEIVIY